MFFAIFDGNSKSLEAFRQRLVEELFSINISCYCAAIDKLEVFTQIDLSKFQVFFLCLDMPVSEGMKLVFAVRRCYPNLIIIVVSNDMLYAVEGYQLKVFWVLLRQRLEQDLSACVTAVIHEIQIKQRFLEFKVPKGTINVPIDEILYLEGTSYRKVKIHLRSDPVIECPGKLVEYANELIDRGFLKIQRSFLVNMRHIVDIKNYWAILDNGEKVKTSTRDYMIIRSRLKEWKKHGFP